MWDGANSRVASGAKSNGSSKRDPRSQPNGVATSVNSLLKPSLKPPIGSSHVNIPGLVFNPSAVRHTNGVASPPGQAPPLQRSPTSSFSIYNASKITHNLAAQDGPVSKPAQSQLTQEDITSVIGFEFKPDVIRSSHPAVISELIDDLPHQCHICGLRFKLEERFNRHIEWHTLKTTSESKTPIKVSRRWFVNSDNWAKENSEIQSSDLPIGPVEIDGEQMVAADENQCVCILCGELFDDFYYRETDKWMFRRAVHLNMKDGATHGPLVHPHCISENSISDLGLSN